MLTNKINRIIEKYPAEGAELIRRSYNIAAQKLEGKSRGNGHPFVEHPIGVAEIVSGEIGLMPEAVAAIFLHEATREDKELLEEISRQFPAECILIAQGLNNISSITLKDTQLQAEQYRKLIVSYSKDPRVTLIKLADRLEIMRNLEIFPKSQLQRTKQRN
jgi:GTP pyrophosphokinase